MGLRDPINMQPFCERRGRECVFGGAVRATAGV